MYENLSSDKLKKLEAEGKISNLHIDGHGGASFKYIS